MGVDSRVLNENGELKAHLEDYIYGVYQELLKKEGIELKFKSNGLPVDYRFDVKDKSHNSLLDFMYKTPEVDFVLSPNTGMKPPSIEFQNYFRSFGCVFFYADIFFCKNTKI
jgi:hypothetical protein